MSQQFFAVLAIASALLATMGSLFLAYDYLAYFAKAKDEDNPLRSFLRILAPSLAGILPGLLLLLAFSVGRVTDQQLINVAISAIALGLLVGIFNAWYMRDFEEDTPKRATKYAAEHPISILQRAIVGLLLGAASGIGVALLVHTSVDNALTTAGSSGPLGMVLLTVWPLIHWTPVTEPSQPSQPSQPSLATLPATRGEVIVAALAVGAIGLAVGVVDGIFDARAPQNLYSCLTAERHCTDIFSIEVSPKILGTACIHGVFFLIGGIIAYLLWTWLEPGLLRLWEGPFTRTPISRRLWGMLITGILLGFGATSLLVFVDGSAPRLTSSIHGLTLLAAALALLSAVIGYFLPLRPMNEVLFDPLPFSRYDALMMACFALCVLIPYIVLTNLGNFAASALGFPHALAPQASPPIQFQRIAFYTQVTILVGIPVALAVGGLTRAVYRWAKWVPNHVLGIVGISLGLLAFLLQLVNPVSVLVNH